MARSTPLPVFVWLLLATVRASVLSPNATQLEFDSFLRSTSLHITPRLLEESQSDYRGVEQTQGETRFIAPHRDGRRTHFVPVSHFQPRTSRLWRRKVIAPNQIRSSTLELKVKLKHLASNNRFDTRSKAKTHQYLYNSFRSFNLHPLKQMFKVEHLEEYGINIIGIRQGLASINNSSEREVIVVGAHFDTMPNTSGLNDNASGVAIMLEVARLIDHHQCTHQHTIIFVAFDLEELGAIGSKYFVNEYLIPNELHRTPTKFKGAIILDTLLNYDWQNDAQDIPNDIHQNVPEFSKSIKQSHYKGDFLAMFARSKADQEIASLIKNQWTEMDRKFSSNETNWKQYRLKPVTINTLDNTKVATQKELHQHINMLRSDHLHFWYHNDSTYDSTLSAVLLTDTGPFRGYMRHCYHKMCDDTRYLSKTNLEFISKTTNVLVQVLMSLGDAKCFADQKTANMGESAKRCAWHPGDPLLASVNILCGSERKVPVSNVVRSLLSTLTEHRNHRACQWRPLHLPNHLHQWSSLACPLYLLLTSWLDFVWIFTWHFQFHH